MTILVRTTAALDVSSDGRNLEGLALTWEDAELVTDDHGASYYAEAFAARSVTRTLRARSEWPVFVVHNHLAGSVGEVTFAATSEGLAWRARMADTRYAGATLERVTDPDHPDGHLGAVSVGFKPKAQQSRTFPGVGAGVYRTEIALAELSLAPAHAAQRSAGKVLAVRSSTTADAGTPRLDALRRRRSLLVTP